MSPLPSKVSAITAMPRPTTRVELQRYLGCINFFHRFLPNIAATLAPLHALVASVSTQKSPLLWTPAQVESFEASKLALVASVKLAHPDPADSLSLTTDASLSAVGAVLSSSDGSPLAFFSKKLTAAEVKYSAFDRELLAVFLSIRHFRHMLEGRPFSVWTDHKPLCGALNSAAEKSPRQTRHLSFISEFTTDIRHVAGSANVVADTLSRPPSVASLSVVPGVVDVQDLAVAQSESQPEMETYINDAKSGLKMEWCSLPGGWSLLCDVSLTPLAPRPVVPASLVPRLLDSLHQLSHPGGNAFLRDLRRRYVWRRMSAQVKAFSRSCLACQRAKITRHSKAPLEPLAMPDRRFAALHLDLVGPLPESQGNTYLLTIIDRYSRWLEAVPLADISARSCARALLHHWVARFGVPDSIVTDQGRQFTSELWADLSAALGVTRARTTSYHPQANGMIERQHRTLKDRLIARACASGSSDWMEHLPFVLLGLRSSVRQDSACSPADLLYGSPLRLPGPMFVPASPAAPPLAAFASRLQSVMRESAPMPVVHHGAPVCRVDPLLQSVSHVFLRIDAVKRPLVAPYEGPFPVVSRTAKTFVILRRGKPVTVSIDRLKPAALLPEVADPLVSSPVAVANLEASSPPSSLDPVPSTAAALVTDVRDPDPAVPRRPSYAAVTRSGRVSRPPDVLQV